jgi:hypothetical protein
MDVEEKTKKRKRVSWAPDEDLVSVREIGKDSKSVIARRPVKRGR